jgi:hypothetical protein
MYANININHNSELPEEYLEMEDVRSKLSEIEACIEVIHAALRSFVDYDKDEESRKAHLIKTLPQKFTHYALYSMDLLHNKEMKLIDEKNKIHDKEMKLIDLEKERLIKERERRAGTYYLLLHLVCNICLQF